MPREGLALHCRRVALCRVVDRQVQGHHAVAAVVVTANYRIGRGRLGRLGVGYAVPREGLALHCRRVAGDRQVHRNRESLPGTRTRNAFVCVGRGHRDESANRFSTIICGGEGREVIRATSGEADIRIAVGPRPSHRTHGRGFSKSKVHRFGQTAFAHFLIINVRSHHNRVHVNGHLGGFLTTIDVGNGDVIRSGFGRFNLTVTSGRCCIPHIGNAASSRECGLLTQTNSGRSSGSGNVRQRVHRDRHLCRLAAGAVRGGEDKSVITGFGCLEHLIINSSACCTFRQAPGTGHRRRRIGLVRKSHLFFHAIRGFQRELNHRLPNRIQIVVRVGLVGGNLFGYVIGSSCSVIGGIRRIFCSLGRMIVQEVGLTTCSVGGLHIIQVRDSSFVPSFEDIAITVGWRGNADRLIYVQGIYRISRHVFIYTILTHHCPCFIIHIPYNICRGSLLLEFVHRLELNYIRCIRMIRK